MRIIVPVHRKRISPVFDWSMKALIIDYRDGASCDREEIDLSLLSEIERVDFLEKMGIGLLLCGGISLQLECIISFRGINVISWISGDIDEILTSFSTGSFQPDNYLLPGVKIQRHLTTELSNQYSKH